MSEASSWSVFPRKDGRWVLKYKAGAAWKQHRLPGGLRSKKEARQAGAMWLAERLAIGDVLPPRKAGEGPTVAEISNRWIALRKKNERLAPATIKDNESHLDKHIRPAFGTTLVAALDAPELREWLRTLRGKVAPYTCRNIASTFRTMLDDAKNERWVRFAVNPMRDSGVSKEIPEGRTRAGRLILVVPTSHAQALINAAELPLGRRLRYLLAFSTGLRDGELSGLTWKDVLLDDDVPHLLVERALRLVGDEEGRVGIGAPKTEGSHRPVPLTAACVSALSWWRAEGWEFKVGAPRTDEAPLLPCTRGKFRGQASRPDSAPLLRRDLEALKLPPTVRDHPLTFHACRRTFATWLDGAGVDGSTIGVLLGHEAKTTAGKHYTAEVMRKLAAAVSHVPLGWPVVRDVVRNVVRGRTKQNETECDFEAPPAGIGPATFGLGNRKRYHFHCALWGI